jgi:hypothetical protein
MSGVMFGPGFISNIRTSMNESALSGREPVSGRFSVRPDSFHRQNGQPIAGLSCKLELYARSCAPACRSSTVHSSEIGCNYVSWVLIPGG